MLDTKVKELHGKLKTIRDLEHVTVEQLKNQLTVIVESKRPINNQTKNIMDKYLKEIFNPKIMKDNTDYEGLHDVFAKTLII